MKKRFYARYNDTKKQVFSVVSTHAISAVKDSIFIYEQIPEDEFARRKENGWTEVELRLKTIFCEGETPPWPTAGRWQEL